MPDVTDVALSAGAAVARHAALPGTRCRLLLRARRRDCRPGGAGRALAADTVVRPRRPGQDLAVACRPVAPARRARFPGGIRAPAWAHRRGSRSGGGGHPCASRPRPRPPIWKPPPPLPRRRCGSCSTASPSTCGMPATVSITPVLVFDQFEEIFQILDDDASAAPRIKQLLDNIAELVENRLPARLAADELPADDGRIDSTSHRRTIASSCRFARTTCRTFASCAPSCPR